MVAEHEGVWDGLPASQPARRSLSPLSLIQGGWDAYPPGARRRTTILLEQMPTCQGQECAQDRNSVLLEGMPTLQRQGYDQ